MATIPHQLPPSVAEALWPSGRTTAIQTARLSLPRLSARRTVTLTVDDSIIRVVAFEGRRIVEWTTLDMNAAGPLTLPRSFAKFTSRFSRKVTDLPFYAPLLRFMEMPVVQRRYLGSVISAETKSTIPFEPTEVDIAWTPQQTKRNAQVIVTATPKREIDAHIDLMNIVGVKPTSMYAKSTALALASGLPNAVVAHLSEGGADLVLVRDDVARSVHRVSLPDRKGLPGPAQADEYAAILTQAIDEIAGFEHEAADDPALDEISEVVLTGQVPENGPLRRALQGALGGRLRKVSPRVAYPDGFPAAAFAANIGLAIADWDSRAPRWWSRAAPTVLATDLLPDRHRTRMVPKQTSRIVLLSMALAAMLTATVMGASQSHEAVASLETQISALERRAQVNAVQASQFNRKRTEIDAIDEQLTALAVLEDKRRLDVTQAIARLSIMTVDSTVRRVNAVSVDHGRGVVRISATATSVNQALAYAQELRDSGLFTAVDVASVSTGAAIGPGGGDLALNIDAEYPDANAPTIP